jgi:hypothetical protein
MIVGIPYTELRTTQRATSNFGANRNAESGAFSDMNSVFTLRAGQIQWRNPDEMR